MMSMVKTLPFRNHFSDIGKASETLVRNFCTQNGLKEHRLVMHWSEIVGNSYSSLVFPQKVITNHASKTATLIVFSKDASFISQFVYHKNTILARINSYFGKSDFRDVKLYDKR